MIGINNNDIGNDTVADNRYCVQVRIDPSNHEHSHLIHIFNKRYIDVVTHINKKYQYDSMLETLNTTKFPQKSNSPKKINFVISKKYNRRD
jgi:hypothetical protein